MKPDASALLLAKPEYALKQLGAPRAAEPCNTNDLAASQLKRHVADRRVARSEVLYLQHDLADFVILRRKALGQLAPDHQPNDLVHRQILRALGCNMSAVAHYRDLVGYAEYLFHLVRDVDYAASARLELLDYAEKMLDLAVVERGGRLVEDDDLRVIGDRLGDLDHLPLADRHFAHYRVGIDLNSEVAKDLERFLAHHALARDKSERGRVSPEPEVVANTPLERLIELLMHHRDAALKRFL